MKLTQESFDNWLSMPVTQVFLNAIRVAKINSTMTRINESNKDLKNIDAGVMAFSQGREAASREFLETDVNMLNESIEAYPVVQKMAREYTNPELGESTPNLSIIKGV